MIVKIFVGASVLLVSTSAWAQSAPTSEQSADDLVCQLSGDCGDPSQPEATKDKPQSRGFKLARKVVPTDPSPSASSTRTGAKAIDEAPQSSGFSSTPGRSRIIAASAPRTAVGRAQLRLTFVTGSAQLTEAGLRETAKFMSALSAPSLAGKKFRIEGHTDANGSREANIDLSKRRAQAVVEYLAANGLDPSRFTVVGYGPDRAENATGSIAVQLTYQQNARDRFGGKPARRVRLWCRRRAVPAAASRRAEVG